MDGFKDEDHCLPVSMTNLCLLSLPSQPLSRRIRRRRRRPPCGLCLFLLRPFLGLLLRSSRCPRRLGLGHLRSVSQPAAVQQTVVLKGLSAAKRRP